MALRQSCNTLQGSLSLTCLYNLYEARGTPLALVHQKTGGAAGWQDSILPKLPCFVVRLSLGPVDWNNGLGSLSHPC